LEGEEVGLFVGSAVGCSLGDSLGTEVGDSVGVDEGSLETDGLEVGFADGIVDNDGDAYFCICRSK
jgi:hypothetical protein